MFNYGTNPNFAFETSYLTRNEIVTHILFIGAPFIKWKSGDFPSHVGYLTP
jgi:hypothetical protein